MAGQGQNKKKKTMREILDAFLRMPAPESALEEKALLLAQARGIPPEAVCKNGPGSRMIAGEEGAQ